MTSLSFYSGLPVHGDAHFAEEAVLPAVVTFVLPAISLAGCKRLESTQKLLPVVVT